MNTTAVRPTPALSPKRGRGRASARRLHLSAACAGRSAPAG